MADLPERAFDLSSRLLAKGLVAELELTAAQNVERTTGRLLEEVLLDAGVLTEETLARFYCQEFSYPYLGFQELAGFLERKVDEDRIIPEELAVAGTVLPLSYDASEGCLEVALAFPTNRSLIDLLLGFAGVKVLRISIAPRSTLRPAIEAAYGIGPIPAALSSTPLASAVERRVLLVEKEAERRKTWAEALRQTRHQVTEADSPAAAADRLKLSDFDLVVSRFGPSWQKLLAITEGSARSAQVRFASGMAEALCGEVVPYAVMSPFFFATLRALVRVFGRSHKVPAEAILVMPRLACAVANRMGLPSRETDEIHFASYLTAIGRALGEGDLAFATTLESVLSPPWRAHSLLAAALEAKPGEHIPIGARILRVTLDFLTELRANGGKPADAIVRCRERARPDDGPALESLIAVLYRERVAQKQSTQREVVVVDNDVTRASLLETALRNEGHLVRPFVNVRVAHAELSLDLPDVLVAATAVPGFDGFSLCRDAKRRLGIPTLLISDRPVEEFDRIRARAVGADRLFEPPLDLPQVLGAVKALLSDAAVPAARPLRCTGSLARLGGKAVLALLTATRARALVHFWSGDRLARAHVAEGEVRPLGDPSDAALDEAMAWKEGSFMVFDQGTRRPDEDTP